MQTKTKGIVLNETPYSETSKILNVLTSDYGMISVISKGCRNVKNKLRGVSNKLNYCEYTINLKENGLSTLIEGNMLNPFKNTFGNMKKSMYSFYLIDLVKQVLNENNNKNIFDILVSSLVKIDEGLSPELISIIVEMRLLEYLGVSLNLSSCIICGSEDNLITIDFNSGGCLCRSCSHDGIYFSEKAFHLLSMLNKIDLSKVSKLEITDDSIVNEIDHFMYEYYTSYTGIYLPKKESILLCKI